MKKFFIGVAVYLLVSAFFLFFYLTSEDQTELFGKMFATPISIGEYVNTNGLSDSKVIAWVVMFLFAMCELAGMAFLWPHYKKVADKYTDYPTGDTYANLETQYDKFSSWRSCRNSISGWYLAFSVIGGGILLGWFLFCPGALDVFDAITPSCNLDGWFVTILISVVFATLSCMPALAVFRYVTINGTFNRAVVLFAGALACVFSLVAVYIIVKTYTVWIFILDLFLAIPYAVFIRPRSRFEKWFDETGRIQSERTAEAARNRVPEGDIDYDGYSGGGGGGGSAYSSLMSRMEKARICEENRRKREERRRREAEAALDLATPRDCAYYCYGIGKEGCSFGGVNGIVVGPCEHEMSVKACPRFRKV